MGNKIAVIMAGVLFLSLCLGEGRVVKAEEEVYYTNSLGVEMTKEQYEIARSIYSEEGVDVLEEDDVQRVCRSDVKVLNKTSKYYLVLENGDSEEKKSSELAISEDMAMKILKAQQVADSGVQSGIGLMSNTSTHTTAMKKITLSIMNYGGNVGENKCIIENTWLSLPSVRSYDVMAIRVGHTSSKAYIESLNNCLVAKQIYDGNVINYAVNDITEAQNGNAHFYYRQGHTDGRDGVGISMNLNNDAKNSLSNRLEFNIRCNDSLFSVFGTYQHATQNVSLENSRDYTLYGTGLGGVILFNKSAMADKYDNTQGLSATWDWNNP